MKFGKPKVYTAPWEKAFDRIISPIEEFIHRQSTSSLLLMACAVLALILANSPLDEAYYHILHSKLVLGTEEWQISMSVHHWVNDGLMTLFFLVVGLELKRELLVGELSQLKQAILPIIAALGGVLLPALFYFLINQEDPMALRGWGIPMATDIAFAIGALSLLGNRVPHALLSFLVALAIVDDLVAVIVIAVFYTAEIDQQALWAVGILFLLLMGLNRAGIRRLTPYALLGVLLWLAMLKSGVHATLSGVLLAFTLPMRPKFNTEKFLEQANNLLDKIKELHQQQPNVILNDAMRSRMTALGNGVNLAQAPAQIMEHRLHSLSAYLVIPIFALANAGIPLDFSDIGSTLSHPVTLGVMIGLLFGKLLGIASFVWLAVQLGIGQLPQGLNFKHIIGAALLGGIGFTMSIFIAELAFIMQPEQLLAAKTGILLTSLVAGFSGYFWLRRVGAASQQ